MTEVKWVRRSKGKRKTFFSTTSNYLIVCHQRLLLCLQWLQCLKCAEKPVCVCYCWGRWGWVLLPVCDGHHSLFLSQCGLILKLKVTLVCRKNKKGKRSKGMTCLGTLNWLWLSKEEGDWKTALTGFTFHEWCKLGRPAKMLTKFAYTFLNSLIVDELFEHHCNCLLVSLSVCLFAFSQATAPCLLVQH